MKTISSLLLWFAPLAWLSAQPKPIDIKHVAILYNQAIPESEALAKSYQKARGVPEENLIGLKMPDSEEITRSVYQETIEAPLRAEFDKRGWWKRGRTRDGMVIAEKNDIQILVCMRGVPLKIARISEPPPANAPANPVEVANEAAVDSELSILSFEGHKLNGPSNNQYYKSSKSFSEAQMPFMMLVGRIDGPSFAICQRLIDDALSAEKTGLWGRAYIDNAQFYPEGDAWIRACGTDSLEAGLPLVSHPWKEVYAKHYPATDLSVYYGWYEWNVCGPFVKPGFTMKKGAVAVHLHSFSAATLRSETANWCGPLLARGAAVTLGNVYEPYLAMTHHFDEFHKRLLQGYTVVEAAYASIPVLSWQGIVLGDPLYRPFLRLDGSGEKAAEDRPYRALRVARLLHQDQDSKYLSELERVAHAKQNPVFLETLGLIYLSRKQEAKALHFIREAKPLYKNAADRLRCDLHVIGVDRDAQRIDLAVKALRQAELIYADIPEIECVKSLITLLDPPAPPPAPAPVTPKK